MCSAHNIFPFIKFTKSVCIKLDNIQFCLTEVRSSVVDQTVKRTEITAEVAFHPSYNGGTDYVLLLKCKNCNCCHVIQASLAENEFLFIFGITYNQIQLLRSAYKL